MPTEAEIAAKLAKYEAEEAEKKAAKLAKYEADEAARKKEDGKPKEDEKPKPKQTNPNSGQDDVTPSFLNEWAEFKKDTGWLPAALRPKPEAPKKKPDCCILYPYCHCGVI